MSHQDLSPRNIILAYSGSLCGAILIDFAFACRADKDSIKDDAYRFEFKPTSSTSNLIPFLSILNVLEKFDVPQYEVKAWCESHLGQPWVRMFADLRFHDKRYARPVGIYPEMADMWTNPTFDIWE
jgi:hypothetical protein